MLIRNNPSIVFPGMLFAACAMAGTFDSGWYAGGASDVADLKLDPGFGVQ